MSTDAAPEQEEEEEEETPIEAAGYIAGILTGGAQYQLKLKRVHM